MSEKINKTSIIISDRTYILYRYSPMGGMETISRLVAALLNPSDWELKNVFVSTLMRNVSVLIEDGTECRMISNEIINKYTESWEDIIRIIRCSLTFNSEHLQDGSLVSWIDNLKTTLKGKIPGVLSGLMPMVIQVISSIKSKKE